MTQNTSRDEWNRRHASAEHADMPAVDIVRRAARDLPPGRALDLACGTGRHSLLLAEHGWRVTAVDFSEVAIQKLRDTAVERGLVIQDTIVADLESDEFVIEGGKFDLICDSYYLQRSLIPRIQSGVRVGGWVAMAIPMFDDTPGLRSVNPEYLVKPGELRSWFEGWNIIESMEDREAAGRRSSARLIAKRTL